MMRSIRGRLLVGALCSSALVLCGLGVSIYLATSRALMNDFDGALDAESRIVMGMLQQNDRKIEFEFDPRQMPDFLSPSQGHFFEILNASNQVVARSPSLQGRDLPMPADANDNVPIRESQFDGRLLRVLVRLFQLKPEEQEDEKPPAIAPQAVRIIVAGEPAGVRRTLRVLGSMLAALCTAATVALGIILLRIVGRGLRPLLDVSQQIESLEESKLSSRVRADGLPTELVPIVEKLNGLLARLESAFAREKGFTADVAHELRTPLTGLRMILEVCRSRQREPAAYESAMDECRAIIDRMESMVESLLLLARSESGQVATSRQQVDLGELLHQCASLLDHRIAERHLSVTWNSTEPCHVQTDREKVRIILGNLLDNAVSHADCGGTIRIRLGRDGDRLVTEIVNSGSGVAQADVPRLFDRFWRGDAARSHDDNHCGLGLSICRRLASLLGGQITIETTVGGDFTARFSLAATKAHTNAITD
jgi:heavy metal sensor kinase